MKRIRMKEILSKIVSFVLIGLFVLLVIVRCLGFTPYVVLSSSMEPIYPVGSLIYVKKIPIENLKVKDNITFVLDESLTVVTHQIVEIQDGNELFYTKGLANDSRDNAPVYYKNILGKATFCVPYLGYLTSVLTTPIGLICSCGFIVIWFILIVLSEKGMKFRKRRK